MKSKMIIPTYARWMLGVVMLTATQPVATRAELFTAGGVYAIRYEGDDAPHVKGYYLANPLAYGGNDWDMVQFRQSYDDNGCAWRINDEGDGDMSVRNTRGGANDGDYIMKDAKIRLASTVNFVDYRPNQTWKLYTDGELCAVMSNAQENRFWIPSTTDNLLSYHTSTIAESSTFLFIPLYLHDDMIEAAAETTAALADNTLKYDVVLQYALEQKLADVQTLLANPGYSASDAREALNELNAAREAFVASGYAPEVSNLGNLSLEERAAMESLSLSGEVTDADFRIMRSDMINLRELNLEQSTLSALPDHALSGLTKLRKVLLPEGLKSIGDAAFLSCIALKEIGLPATLESIGALAFARSGLVTIEFPAQVKSIGDYALEGCAGLRVITVAESNTAYKAENNLLYTIDGATLLKGAPLSRKEVTLPDGLKTVAPYAMQGSSSLNGAVVLPKSLEVIGDYAFAHCSGFEGELVLPAGLKTIGRGAFFGTKGISGTLSIPDAVTEVGVGAFAYLPAVTEISLPASLKDIAGSTFECCNGVTVIRANSTEVPAVGPHAMRGIDRRHTYVAVPDGSEDAYKAADVWSEFLNYDAPFDGYAEFATNGKYYIQCAEEGDCKDFYLAYADDGNGTRAILTDEKEGASVWDLDFFTVNSNALSYVGRQGSDIRFMSNRNYLHINMEGKCYSDPVAGYVINNNRTFVFWLEPNSIECEYPTVAIQGNGTIWGVNHDLAYLTSSSFSELYPRESDFIFRLVPEEQSDIIGISSLETDGTSQYYDMRGIRVSGTQSRGVYIKNCGGKITKIIL